MNLIADTASIELQLAFTRPARTNSTSLTAKHNPLPNQARQQVLELGQMHLKFSLMTPSSHGKNIQNQLHTVNDLGAQAFFQIDILARCQTVIDNDGRNIFGINHLPDLF